NETDLEVLTLIEEEAVQLFNDERINLRQLAKENKRTHNRNCKKLRIYRVGDLVVINRTQFDSGLKIKKKYLGPYKVTCVKGNNRYEVIRIDEGEGSKVTSSSADYMKAYNIGSSRTEETAGMAECGDEWVYIETHFPDSIEDRGPALGKVCVREEGKGEQSLLGVQKRHVMSKIY
ncbi:hypothetical protein WH47_10546, partial [Habropoda laboriosa]